jgi:hypothetical protein
VEPRETPIPREKSVRALPLVSLKMACRGVFFTHLFEYSSSPLSNTNCVSTQTRHIMLTCYFLTDCDLLGLPDVCCLSTQIGVRVLDVVCALWYNSPVGQGLPDRLS